MKEYIMYLAGPMGGLTKEQAIRWRSYVTSKVPKNIHTLTPMRDVKRGSGRIQQAGEFSEDVFDNQKSATRRDRHDIKRSDLVFFNFLGATRVSIGTCIEVGWADAWRKIKIAVIDKENIHSHPLLKECMDYIVPDLDTGIKVVKSIFGESNQEAPKLQRGSKLRLETVPKVKRTKAQIGPLSNRQAATLARHSKN